ncbi:MAG: RNA methyltransferase [Candidatus Micrarchaeia archaeon]
MKIRLIIQEPKYQLNVGYIARVAKNFGIEKLYFIKPRANIRGKKAITFAKHAASMLKEAKIYQTIDEAVKGCLLVVGTTGIWNKAKAGYKNAVLLDEAVARIRQKCKGACEIAIIIGRDDIGMKKEELEKCDMIVFIPTNPRYPVLNISHALAVLLYELTKASFAKEYEQNVQDKPSRQELSLLFGEFAKLISNKKIRNKKVVQRIFEKTVINTGLNKKEVHALITALK